jgi:hypothetical protein
VAALWIALSLLLALLWPLCACPVSPVHDFGTEPYVIIVVRMLMCVLLCGSRVVRLATL